MQLIRRDVGYTIISRFEEAYRHFLSNTIPVFWPDYESKLPSGIVQKARDRSGEQKWESIEDFLQDTDFPDLKEITTFSGMYKSFFPESAIQQSEFDNTMTELYELRCKIAHVKQYFTSLDLDVLSENSKKIARELNGFGKDFLEFTFELGEHPEQVVVPTPIEFLSDVDFTVSSIPHNVPTPDYEFEGGFVGRDDDVKKIISLLDGNLHRVITISGAGGVGKTALALRVVQKYLRSKNNPFDGIVWLSAKETKLSYLGIEDVEPTLRNYEELLDTVLDVMGYGVVNASVEQKEADINTLFDIHNPVLIVVDNLETITDERIINFILDAHPKTKILITSRKGLGQVERRHELKQLKEKEAIALFRLISRDKRLQSLITLDDETIKFYVKKIACYPLAIKWVIGQVAIGKDINQVISSINETTNDISRFCFDQIFKSLSDPSRKILCALSMFDDSPSLGILNYVLNFSSQNLEDSLRELILVSLVIPEQYKTEQEEISTKYVLLSLTRGYVRQQLDQDSLLKRELSERLQTVQTTLEEAERAKRQYRFSLANLGANSEEEKIASMIATTAFQKYQGGRYLDAVSDYKNAIRIAPRFASVYRNWAVMESQEGHSPEAEQLIKKASELSPKDPQIWLTWGNIKRKEDKIREALSKYEEAYRLSPEDSVVLNSLGQAKTRLGDYEEADNLFRLAIQKEAAGDSRRHRIINLSSMIDNLVRWSDSYINGRDYQNAEAKLNETRTLCKELISLDRSDIKSQDLDRLVLIKSGSFYIKNNDPIKAIRFFEKAIDKKPSASMRVKEMNDYLKASIQLANLYFKTNDYGRVRKVLTTDLRKIASRPIVKPNLQEEFFKLWDDLNKLPSPMIGKVIRFDPQNRFVVIEAPVSSGSTFVGYKNNFSDHKITDMSLLLGKDVTFYPYEGVTENRSRKEAKSITLLL